MKQFKTVLFSDKKFAPYTIENKDIDNVVQSILGAFKFSLNYWIKKNNQDVNNKENLNPNYAARESATLKNTLEIIIKKYTSKIKIDGIEQLRALTIDQLISYYLKCKQQGKSQPFEEHAIKDILLKGFTQLQNSAYVNKIDYRLA